MKGQHYTPGIMLLSTYNTRTIILPSPNPLLTSVHIVNSLAIKAMMLCNTAFDPPPTTNTSIHLQISYTHLPKVIATFTDNYIDDLLDSHSGLGSS